MINNRLDELADAISKSHDTAVGPDDIHYQMLKHLPADCSTPYSIFSITFGSLENFHLPGVPLQLFQYLNPVKMYLILLAIAQLPSQAAFARLWSV